VKLNLHLKLSEEFHTTQIVLFNIQESSKNMEKKKLVIRLVNSHINTLKIHNRDKYIQYITCHFRYLQFSYYFLIYATISR